MSENFNNKKVVVDEIKERAKNAKSIVLLQYQGLTVAQDSQLRNSFRKEGCEYKVYKNRLIQKAFDDLGIKFDDNTILEGTTSVAFSNTDVVAPARIAAKGTADFKILKIKAGYAEGKVLSANEVDALAKIPSREVLLTQLVGMLQMPIKKLAMTVKAVAEKN